MTKELEFLNLKLDKVIELLSPTLLTNWAFWNTVVLIITLFVLIWYTVETHKIANQTEESNLRPIILRGGFVENWENVKFKFIDGVLLGEPLELAILKNIAIKIEGYIVINGFKYTLLFGSNISKSKTEDNNVVCLPSWGWVAPGTSIFAVYDEKSKKESKEKDGLVINYKDIAGNSYFTKEDENFNQTSFKGRG